ncbi:MAG: TonB-dependent copper receptor [Alphaproteobacteria bacterium]|nr:TonB-dependent copper receptor [Alphaproteobacteria bacterium]
MNRTILCSLMAGTICTWGFSFQDAQAQQALPEMSVEATALPTSTPNFSFIRPQDLIGATAHDGGDFLGSIPGISVSRIGGHGVEPVIHGQQQNQLNIINDGAYIHGAGPNRMDPPSSFAAIETFDTITVLRGYQSVQHGAGGTGGTVLFERNALPFADDKVEWSSNFGSGYESNGNIKNAYADVAGGNSTFQMRAIATTADAHSYDDGNGDTVRSAFKSNALSLLPVWSPTENTEITAGLDIINTDDVLFEGAGMDSPEDEVITYRFGVDQKIEHDILRNITFNAYNSNVDHLMDNFTLRENLGMKMKTSSSSDTFGGTLSGDLVLHNVPFTFGADLQNNTRDAKRFSGMAMASDATTQQSYMWPDVTLRQTGIFVEAEPYITTDTLLRVGARYDYVRAEANAANQVFGALSANALYLQHYGTEAKAQNEHNFGGLLRLEHDLSAQTTVFAGISRSVRTADATERFMAGNSGMAVNRWVGNPYLDPEKHHQIDIGVSTGNAKRSISLSGYYDDISDFIMRDTARGQDGIIATSGETIYRNIDATLAGLELETSYQITPRWNLSGTLAWTYGENEEDHDALAQIPPLEGDISLGYTVQDWSVGTRINFASKQSRIDDDSSQRDVQETSGWASMDVYGSYDLKPFEVQLGASNIFDNEYALHLSRSNAFDPVEVQINEPGRSFFLKLYARF